MKYLNFRFTRPILLIHSFSVSCLIKIKATQIRNVDLISSIGCRWSLDVRGNTSLTVHYDRQTSIDGNNKDWFFVVVGRHCDRLEFNSNSMCIITARIRRETKLMIILFKWFPTEINILISLCSFFISLNCLCFSLALCRCSCCLFSVNYCIQ